MLKSFRSKITLFLVIFFLFSYNTIFAQRSEKVSVHLPYYPSFSEVTTNFFTKYAMPPQELPNYYCFAKKPDGWHLLLIDYNENKKELQDYLFWSRQNKSYLKLKFPAVCKDSLGIIPKDFNTWDDKYFSSVLPCWGYVGWDADVVKDYSSMDNLSDSMLNALARAYQAYALNLLCNNTGFSCEKTRFKLEDGLNSLSSNQLDTYRKYEHLAIETYKKLWLINPKFENFVADIYTVYSHEIMNSFLMLRYFQNEIEAHKELDCDLYSPFYISMAKNFLASCDSAAIIFTNGDTDTYPLLYVQEREGFRQDVLVVNLSLIGSGRYLNHLLYKFGKSDPLSTNIDKNLYMHNNLSYLYIDKDIENKVSIEAKDFFNLLNSDTTKNVIPYRLKLTIDKDYLKQHHIVAQNENALIESALELEFTKRDVIYQSELAMLDIISCTNFKRPIYYTETVADENFLGFEKYMQLEGLAYKLVPIKTEFQDYEYGRINTASLYDKTRNKFFYNNFEPSSYITENEQRLTINYRLMFGRLAEALVKESKPDSAVNILNFCFQKFPTETFQADYSCLRLAECYFQVKKNEKAIQLVIEMFKRYSRELDEFLKKKSTQEDKNKIQMALYILQELSKLTNTKYHIDKIGSEIDSAFNNYRNKLYPD